METTTDYRGKGISETKFKKDGEPKRSGNWSYAKIHAQNMQSKDWRVHMRDGALMVGDHTPLLCLMPAAVVELAMTDKHFEEYHQQGIVRYNGKEYEAHIRLRKRHMHYQLDFMNFEFLYQEIVYTDGEFDYQFKEY